MAFKDNLKRARLALNLTQQEVADQLGVNKSTYCGYETGKREPDVKKIKRLAAILKTSGSALLETTPVPATATAATVALVSFPVIGKIDAGYDGQALEEYTGTQEAIPIEDLHGRPASDFMVLRINGSSMYPLLLDGDRILVERTTSVDSGSLAVVLFNGEDATVKRVRYKYGEDWLELVPQNPEYEPKRIEGPDLEECRVIGKVLKLIRTLE